MILCVISMGSPGAIWKGEIFIKEVTHATLQSRAFGGFYVFFGAHSAISGARSWHSDDYLASAAI